MNEHEQPRTKSQPRARLIKARTMISNVIVDVGNATDLRERLRGIVSRVDEILSSMRYLPDMPALGKEERP